MRWRFLILVILLFFKSDGQNVTCQSWKPFYRVFRVTAYCPCEKCCGVHSNGKTATGKNAFSKGVAVDKNVIKIGSRLDIPGYGSWIEADDVGGAIRGGRLDVRFSSHEDALKWGVKKLRVRVWVQ